MRPAQEFADGARSLSLPERLRHRQLHTAVDSPVLPSGAKGTGERGGNATGAGEKEEWDTAAVADAVAAAAAAAGMGGSEGVASAAELVGLHVPNRTHLWLQSTVPIG